MAMYHVNYKGLRERPNYDELINYLQTGQETIRYPDRFAKLLRESPYLTQLDGQGMEEMDEQQRQIKRHEQLMNAIEQVASNTKQSRHLLQAEQSQNQTVPSAPVQTPDVSGFQSAVDETIEDPQQRANQRRGEFLRRYEEHLGSLTPSADTVRGAVHSLAQSSQQAAAAAAPASIDWMTRPIDYIRHEIRQRASLKGESLTMDSLKRIKDKGELVRMLENYS